ncbi:unnamed protein product [Rotaria sp. Silwood2]|nr:unnamed protein product [Rotaria sp. Silwood2]
MFFIESNYDDGTNDAALLINNNKNNQETKQQKITKKQRQRVYLEPNRIMHYMQDNAATIISSRGNQAYILATATIYDEWVRNNYDLQRTKKRDDTINNRFVQKKINGLTTSITQASATISSLQVQLTTYWTQTIGGGIVASTSATTNANRTRDPADRLEKIILKYIHYCTQHVKKMAEQKIQLARAEIEEYKALASFEQIANPLAATKRIEYDIPPKFISNIDFTFKLDETIFNKDEAQILYNQMHQLTKDYRTQVMSLFLQSITREREMLTNEIEHIIEGFPKEENDERFDVESGYIEFKRYNELREK